MKKISILGAGWLGSALAKKLLDNNYDLHVSVKSETSYNKLSFKNKYILNEQNLLYSENFYNTDVLIISIPPRGNFLQNLKIILSYIDDNTQVILCSSTSVYTQNIDQPSLMLEAESLVQNIKPQSLILRLGGLMGYDRVAGKYTAGKSVANDSPVNYVHRDDVINIIKLCISNEIKTNIYNIVAPIHSSKKSIYDYNSNKFSFEKTNFETLEKIGKEVSSKKLQEELNYVFIKKDPMDFWD